MLTKYLIVFFVSMVPLIELRGAIPIAAGMGLTDTLPHMITAFIVAIVGNMLPVPIIFLFARKFLEWGQDKKYLAKICQFFLTKGHNAGEKLTSKASKTGIFIALMLFVGIPLPGTGAWTGTLAASLLDLDMKTSTFSVLFGVLIAGVIMGLAGTGIFSFFR